MAMKSHDFLRKYSTKVPLIQRDYVQGANRWEEKRNPFVTTLLTALSNGKPEPIHFIYGTTSGKTNEFIPLDGQQRLTTLNLLGWLLLQYVCLNTSEDDEDRRQILSGWRKSLALSYETRDSSREFCRHLIEMNLSSFTAKPSREILDCIWFAESWKYDPTIKAIIEMLDYIATRLVDGSHDIAMMAERFFTDSPIEFEQYDLTLNKGVDDLYIKINARGKPLTDFEHWKAWFIGMLESEYPSRRLLRAYLEVNIEDRWCDSFWKYAIDAWKEAEKKGKKHRYPRIDEYFMRFFDFVTEFLWASRQEYTAEIKEYLEGKRGTSYTDISEEGRREIIKSIYSDPRNIINLFRLLDTLGEVGRDGFFDKYLFSVTDPKNESIADDKRVNIFDERGSVDSVNLLELLIEGKNLSLRLRLLLWGILNYVARHRNKPNKDLLLEFIRVWWGYLMNLRQRRLPKYEVTADISLSDYTEKKIKDNLAKLLADPDPFVSAAGLYTGQVKDWYDFNNPDFHTAALARYEKDVIPLQNHPWLLYDVHNLRQLINDPSISPGDIYAGFFSAFVIPNNKDRVRTMLRNGFGGVQTNCNGYLTYGLSGNWPYILTAPKGMVDESLCRIVSGVTMPVSIAKWPAEFVEKYLDTLYEMNYDFAALYRDTEMGILFGTPMGYAHKKVGYRLEPYNYVVARKAGYNVKYGKTLVKYASGISDEITLVTENSTHWGICFPQYGLQFEPVKNGWRLNVYDPGRSPLPVAFTDRFNLLASGGDYSYVDDVIPNPLGIDSVEAGVILLKEIISLL